MQNHHYDSLSENAMLSLDAAICLAGEMGHTYIGTEHYLLGMLHQMPIPLEIFSGSITFRNRNFQNKCSAQSAEE